MNFLFQEGKFSNGNYGDWCNQTNFHVQTCTTHSVNAKSKSFRMQRNYDRWVRARKKGKLNFRIIIITDSIDFDGWAWIFSNLWRNTCLKKCESRGTPVKISSWTKISRMKRQKIGRNREWEWIFGSDQRARLGIGKKNISVGFHVPPWLIGRLEKKNFCL